MVSSFTLQGQGDSYQCCFEHFLQAGRFNFNQHSPLAAIDIDDFQVKDGRFNINGQPGSGSKGADAADPVAGQSHGLLRIAGRDLFTTQLPGQLFARHLPITVHQHQETASVFILEHQGLNYNPFFQAKDVGRLPGPAFIFIFVQVHRKRYFLFAQRPYGRCYRMFFFAHSAYP